MNEIITKLDEIEKKAESILTEAAAEKEKMLKQLEFDKREMDGRYTSMRQKQEEEIKQQLLSEAESGKKSVRRGFCAEEGFSCGEDF